MADRRWIVPSVIAASVAVGGVAGAMIGGPDTSGAAITVADTGSASTSSGGSATPSAVVDMHMRGPGPELEAAAKALNLSADDLREKLSDGTTTIADVAKQQNVDINTVIDAMVAADRDRIEDMVNNPLPDKGPGGRGFHMHFGGDLGEAAAALGMAEDELHDALESGKSIADIAVEKNIDVNTIIDKLVQSATAKIDQAVTDGDLTQEQADKIKADVKEHVTDLVNGELPKFRAGRGPFGGPPGG
jgi:hypothetical protein